MEATADIIKVGAIILDSHGRILISKSRGRNLWYFVGGKIEKGETHEDCLRRELREELGVEISGTPTWYAASPVELADEDKQGRTLQIFQYLVSIVGEPKASSEIESIHWLSKEEFLSERFPLGRMLKLHAIPALIADGHLH